MGRLIRSIFDSPRSVQQFITYIVIGALAVGVDFGTLAFLLRTHIAVALAVSIAFFASVVVHFTLNKYYNFRNFDRPVHQQARTYLLVATIVWLFTLGWVEFFVRYFGTPVLVAKVLNMPVTVVIGYLATRFLTFGPGIGSSVRMWLAGRSAAPISEKHERT